MILGLSHLVVLVVLVLMGLVVGKTLFKADSKIEERRRNAAKLAASLTAYGLKRIPAMLIDYSVADYTGMAEKMKALVELGHQGDQAVIGELDSVFDKVLERKLETEAGRALIAAKLSDATLPSDPSSVQQAPSATVASVARAA